MMVDEAFDPIISQEFQPIIQGPAPGTAPRKRLVLRAPRNKSFSERVTDEINVTVRTDVHGSVNVRSAGKFVDTAADGTIRPSSVPRYVSALSGMPTGPFFQTPKASATAGYLYMHILSIENVEGKPDSVYFVIRNGIDTLATTPVSVGGSTGSTVNQEFRILTDPSVSITMWMRFRSDAIVSRRRNAQAGPVCLPPLLRKLVRRNTRTRTRGNGDSVFDFAVAGAGGQDRYPERGTSAAYGDARSHGATQAASSMLYDPGTDVGGVAGGKGLAQSRVTEETRGVAVVHVGEMLNEVFLRGLVDSWDVENVWESRRGARVQLQLLFIPECSLFREDKLLRTLNPSFMSQRGDDTRFWRRRYFRLVGGFLFAYHETSRAPRCFIDLNDATRIVDHSSDRQRLAQRRAPALSAPRRRPTHGRNSSNHTDSGIVSLHASNDNVVDSGIQHSFSIEFGEGGSIEFYMTSEKEKRVWVEVIRRLIGAIQKIPSWLIKLLHTDVSDHIGSEAHSNASESSIGSHSIPSSRFHALAHPHTLL
ncbi:Bud site selection protein bud4 [Coemansia furcata]|nr:Bud site selection protein bud4 [Coemansia furcata]